MQGFCYFKGIGNGFADRVSSVARFQIFSAKSVSGVASSERTAQTSLMRPNFLPVLVFGI